MTERFFYIKKLSFSLYKHILDILFPIECVNCRLPGAWLCSACAGRLCFNQKSYCLHCYRPRPLGKFCEKAAVGFSLEGIIIAGDYKNEVLKNLIKTYKYQSIKNLSALLFEYLSAYLEKNGLRRAWLARSARENALIIPVPLHKKRQALRGYNQAGIIAERLSKKYHLELNQNNLKRKKNNRPQAKLKGRQRLANLRDNFVWTGGNLNNRPVIIFDDITTTGTTLNECARALKRSGAGRIWGMVIAKG